MAQRRRSGLMVVWIALGVLVAAIIVLEGPDLMAPGPNQTVALAQLFSFTEPELGGIQVVYERQIATLMRGPDGLWFQHDDSHSHGGIGGAQAPADADDRHMPDPAQSAAIAERLAQATNMPAERLPLDDTTLQATGLARSETMIAFYSRGEEGADFSEPITVLRIGRQRPDATKLYARLDTEPDLALISQSDFASLLEIVFGEGKVPGPAAD